MGKVSLLSSQLASRVPDQVVRGKLAGGESNTSACWANCDRALLFLSPRVRCVSASGVAEYRITLDEFWINGLLWVSSEKDHPPRRISGLSFVRVSGNAPMTS
jgi:hypothetical protein